MKKAIIILLIIFSAILIINLFVYEEVVYEESKVCEVRKEETCDYFVIHEGTELCVSEDLKDYIENIESGFVNRLKSQRGVFK